MQREVLLVESDRMQEMGMPEGEALALWLNGYQAKPSLIIKGVGLAYKQTGIYVPGWSVNVDPRFGIQIMDYSDEILQANVHILLNIRQLTLPRPDYGHRMVTDSYEYYIRHIRHEYKGSFGLRRKNTSASRPKMIEEMSRNIEADYKESTGLNLFLNPVNSLNLSVFSVKIPQDLYVE